MVPLTAGACSPRRMSSRRIPRQTSRPDPALMTAEAQRCGDIVRRLNLPRRYCRTADPLARWMKQRSAGYASVPSRFGPPPGHAPSLVRAVDPLIEASNDWHHCHRRTAQAQQDQPCSTGWWATSVGRRATSAAQRLWPRSTSAHWRGENRQERLLWVVCGRVGLATQPRPGSRLG